MKTQFLRRTSGILLALSIAFVSVLPQTVMAAETTEAAVAAETSDTAESDDSAVKTALSAYSNLGVAVVSDFLNIRKTASSYGTIVGTMKNHNVCEILGSSGSWLKVKSGSVKGYVYSKYIVSGTKATSIASSYILKGTSLSTATAVEEDTSSDSTRTALITYAKKFVGNPYRWGGTSLTKGADCSGFTLSVYAKYGKSLPHSSSAQSKCGKRVSLSKIKPGDLLFYGSGSSINHVAIYIGNGKIVHAANAKSGIKISSAYYSSPICAVSLLD